MNSYKDDLARAEFLGRFADRPGAIPRRTWWQAVSTGVHDWRGSGRCARRHRPLVRGEGVNGL